MVTVFAWQVLVVLSVGIARLFSKQAMIVVAFCWTAFIIFAVFGHWLIMLQLASVWGTVGVISIFHRMGVAKKGPEAGEPVSVPVVPHMAIPTQSELDTVLPATVDTEKLFESDLSPKLATSQISKTLKRLSQFTEEAAARAEAHRDRTISELAETADARRQKCIAESKRSTDEKIARVHKKLDSDPQLAAIYAALERGDDPADIIRRRMKLPQDGVSLLENGSSSPEGDAG